MNTAPATKRAIALPPAAISATRSESELVRILSRPDPISHATHGLDQVDAELLSQAPYEHFDGVRIPIEVLVVEMLGELRPRHHFARVVHQVLEHLVFVRSELDRSAVDSDAARLEVEHDGPAGERVGRVSRSSPHQRTNARQHL